MQSKKIKRIQVQGFTLVELVVTLAIAGVLLAYAIPSFRDFGLRQKVSNEANELLGDLMYARVTAIKEGQSVVVLSNNGTDWSNGWRIFIDNNRDLTFNAGDIALREKQLTHSNLTLTAVSGSVAYTNLGNALAINNISITHSDISKAVTLNLSLSGVITTIES
jgi:type IV fimbrial biogenesis protein FimT